MPQLLHGQVLDDAFLDLVEIVVVLVEHAARFDRIEPILGRLRPGDVEHPVEVGANHLVLGRRGRHPLEAIDFAKRSDRDRLRQLGVDDPPPDLRSFALAFAELRLDGLELLAQHVFTLRVGHLLFGLRLNLPLQLEDLDLARERHRDRIELHREAVLFEELLLVLGPHVEEAGEDVDDSQRIVERRHQRLDFRREPGRQAERAIDELLQPPDVGFDLDGAFGGFRERLQQRGEDAAVVAQELRAGADHPLDQDAHASWRLRHLPDDADGADPVQIVERWFLGFVLLQQQQDEPVAGERAIDRLDGDRTADAERRDGQRQDYRFAERYDRKFGREGRSLCGLSHGESRSGTRGDLTWFECDSTASHVGGATFPNHSIAVRPVPPGCRCGRDVDVRRKRGTYHVTVSDQYTPGIIRQRTRR